VVTVVTPPAGADRAGNTSGGPGGKTAPGRGSKGAGPSHAVAPPPTTPTTQTTQTTHAAQPSQNEEEEPPPSPCGGDSASDDPSDDSCSP
jgi:hypothetical protein